VNVRCIRLTKLKERILSLSDIVKYFRENHYNGIYIFEVDEQGSYFATSIEKDDPTYDSCMLALESAKAEIARAEATTPSGEDS
jgi:hypothetical protein